MSFPIHCFAPSDAHTTARSREAGQQPGISAGSLSHVRARTPALGPALTGHVSVVSSGLTCCATILVLGDSFSHWSHWS